MEVLEAIRTRRSVRSYEPREVERDKLETIIEAGVWAPSGQNLQPCNFIVVTNRDAIEQLEGEIFSVGAFIRKFLPIIALFSSDLRGNKGRAAMRTLREKVFHGAPALIIIGAMKDSSTTYRQDCALAAQNMMLAAHSLGLGTCCIGWIKMLNFSKKAKKILGAPKGFEITDGIVAGYPTNAPTPPKRKSLSEVVHWIE